MQTGAYVGKNLIGKTLDFPYGLCAWLAGQLALCVAYTQPALISIGVLATLNQTSWKVSTVLPFLSFWEWPIPNSSVLRDFLGHLELFHHS